MKLSTTLTLLSTLNLLSVVIITEILCWKVEKVSRWTEDGLQ